MVAAVNVAPNSPIQRVLLAECDAALADLFQGTDPKRQVQIERVSTAGQYLDRLSANAYDLILSDSREKAASALELLSQITCRQPAAKVILLVQEGTADDIEEAIRRHAFSYFSSPYDSSNVVSMMTSALELPAWKDGLVLSHGRSGWISLKVHAQLLMAERAYQFLKEFLIGIPEAVRDKISTAFRELLMNAIEYGAGFQPELTVDVTLIRTHRALIFQIKDPGKGFSLSAVPHAAISNPPDQPIAHMQYRMEKGMRDGGFGILIAQELVDELHFNAIGNEALLIKYLN
jgi:CheY-like chemotaxis protein